MNRIFMQIAQTAKRPAIGLQDLRRNKFLPCVETHILMGTKLLVFLSGELGWGGEALSIVGSLAV